MQLQVFSSDLRKGRSGTYSQEEKTCLKFTQAEGSVEGHLDQSFPDIYIEGISLSALHYLGYIVLLSLLHKLLVS